MKGVTIKSRSGLVLVLAAMMASGAAHAANPGATLRKHDSSQPVNITADHLEVLQKQNVAVFNGQVQAVQGDLTLNADQIKVFYSGDIAGGQASAAPAISRIDANGQVVLASPSENAHGDWAVYDVDKHLVTMGGAVELKQDGNILRGNRLEIDLDSGRSRIDGGPGTGASGGRVTGTFTPKRAEQQK